MRPLSPTARRHVDDLTLHYERLGHSKAIRNLMSALAAVSDKIEATNGNGFPAPSPYRISLS